jgi:hypothetical protein
VLGAGEAQQRDDGFEEPHPGLGRVAAVDGGAGQLGEEAAELRRPGTQRGTYLVEVGGRQVVADRLYERQVGKGEVGFAAAARQDLGPEPVGAILERGRESRLPHPGFAPQEGDNTVASQRGEERVLEL